MDKEKVCNYVNKISDVLDDKIKIITSIEYHYDLEKLISFINDLSEKEVEVVLEQLINDKLEEIKSCLNIEKYRENKKLIDEVMEFFIGDDNVFIVEEGSYVVFDLINKVIGVNGRKINTPIKIEYIKDYFIRNTIGESDIKKTLLWIVLELTVISYFFNNKK